MEGAFKMSHPTNEQVTEKSQAEARALRAELDLTKRKLAEAVSPERERITLAYAECCAELIELSAELASAKEELLETKSAWSQMRDEWDKVCDQRTSERQRAEKLRAELAEAVKWRDEFDARERDQYSVAEVAKQRAENLAEALEAYDKAQECSED